MCSLVQSRWRVFSFPVSSPCVRANSKSDSVSALYYVSWFWSRSWLVVCYIRFTQKGETKKSQKETVCHKQANISKVGEKNKREHIANVCCHLKHLNTSALEGFIITPPPGHGLRCTKWGRHSTRTPLPPPPRARTLSAVHSLTELRNHKSCHNAPRKYDIGNNTQPVGPLPTVFNGL